MPNFNGDVVFIDSSGQVRAQSGDLTLRADGTNTRSIIVGSGVSLRPDRDLFIDLGRDDLRWFRTHTGHLAAHSGYLGADPASATPYPTMSWDDNGFSVVGDFPTTKVFSFTQTNVLIVGAALSLIGGADISVDGSADFNGGITGTLTSSRVAPAFDTAGNEFASVGAVGLRYDAMYAGSGVFNHLAPPTSGTFIVIEDGDLVPIVDARRAVGTLNRRWARVHAASGIFNTIGAPASGTRVDAAASIVPNRHNIYSLGTTGQRWANIFATSGTIQEFSATNVTGTTASFNDATIRDLTLDRSLLLNADGFQISQIGQVFWDLGVSSLDFSNGAVNFESISTSNGVSVAGGILTDTLGVSSNAGITGTLTTRNIVPQTDRLYAIGTNALRYSRVHAASGIFNQLAAPTSGTFIQSNASLLPEIDSVYSLGTSTRQWGNLFAVSGTVATLNSSAIVSADITATANLLATNNFGVFGLTTFIGPVFLGSVTAPAADATASVGVQNLRLNAIYGVSGFLDTISPVASGGMTTLNGSLFPDQDLTRNLGGTARRWAVVEAGSGTFATRATIKGAPVVTNRDARTTVHAVVTANSGAIISSTAERDIYNYTIPANTLSPSGKLSLECIGSFTNMAGANVNMTPRVYINGIAIWGDVLAVAQGPRAAHFALYADICSLGSMTGQRVGGSVELGTRTAGSITGNGDFGTANVGGTWSSQATSGVVDFSAPVTLRVSMQLGTSSTNASYSGFHCILTHQPFPTL
jgi:hypothetical protein